MAQVSATVAELKGVAVVALRGDLSGAAVLHAQSYLSPLLRRTPPILVIDLSGLRTCDSTGALMLEAAARIAVDRGGEVRLAAPIAAVSRTLRQTGTLDTADAFRTVSAAVRAERRDLLAGAEPFSERGSAVKRLTTPAE